MPGGEHREEKYYHLLKKGKAEANTSREEKILMEGWLSQNYFKQLPTSAVLLDFNMQFVEIVSNGNEQGFGENLSVSSQ